MTVVSTGKHVAVAIDGPAGAGKTSTAKTLAEQLDFTYIDTGAMFRAFSVHKLWLSKELGEPVSNETALNTFDFEFRQGEGVEQDVIVCGKRVNEFLRTPEVSMEASNVGTDPVVRAAMLALQRKMAETCDCIMEGRDIGTVVLPNAMLKIFLTAEPEIRAERRLKDLGEGHTLEEVLEDIKARDLQDSTRAVAPLKKADDAILLDNSNLTFEETVCEIMWLVHGRRIRRGS